jgi:Holliday junction resolvase RusA-like endonuclease
VEKVKEESWSYGPYEMPGQLCSKSNSRRIVQIRGQVRVIKSAEALAYVESFKRWMPKPVKPFEGPIALDAFVFYKDWRRDLDIALLQDCLQAHGIIKNDRQVIQIHAYRYIDKENPRTRFFLSETQLPNS